MAEAARKQTTPYTPEQIRAAAAHVGITSGPERDPSTYTQEQIQAAAKFVESQPPSRQEKPGFFERAAISRAEDEPERLEEGLKNLGFTTKRVNGEVQIALDGKFVPWDPAGFDLGDIADVAPTVAEVGLGVAAGGAKVLGALGAPLTGGASLAAASGLSGIAGAGLETGLQAAEKATGFRKELDPARIGQAGLETAIIPGAGKVISKAGRGIAKTLGRSKVGKTIVKKAPKELPEKPTKLAEIATRNKAAPKVTKEFFTGAEKGLAKVTVPKKARLGDIASAMVDLPENVVKTMFPKHGGKAILVARITLLAMGDKTQLIPNSVVKAVIKKTADMTLPQLERVIRSQGAKAAGAAGRFAKKKATEAVKSKTVQKVAAGAALGAGAGLGAKALLEK
jgi:hypothetical protein